MKQNEATARSYAKALFDLARERNQTDAISQELATVAGLVKERPELGDLLSRPWLGVPAKRAAASDLAGRLSLSPLMRDFLVLVAARNRANYLPAIAAAYRRLVDQAEGRARVKLRTAIRLTDAERRSLSARLSRMLEGRELVIEETVDERLLGGFIAEVDSMILDGSLDTQLARMGDRLARA
jgi:F-type H+-transporting ATPase subunit delta